MSSKQTDALGDLKVEEAKKWKARNRAKVFPGKLNRWVFIVHEDHAGSDQEIERVLKGAMKRVGGSVQSASDFKLVRTSESAITPRGRLQRREQLPYPPIPFVKPGRVVWAEVEFAWRSPLESVPWPVEDMALGLLPVHDPTQAEWMLDAVGVETGEAPERRSPIETSIDELVDSAVATPQRAVFSAALVGTGVWLLLRKLKG